MLRNKLCIHYEQIFLKDITTKALTHVLLPCEYERLLK